MADTPNQYRGYIAVDRALFDDARFAPDVFSEREAFLWMVAQAAWKARTIRVGRSHIHLERGQLAFSVRFLSEKFQWPIIRVRRFLDRISDAKSMSKRMSKQMSALVSKRTSNQMTLITVCNFDEFQKSGRTVEQPNEQTDEQANDTQNGTKKNLDTNLVEKEVPSGSEVAAPVYTDARHELWAEGPALLISLGEKEIRARQMIGTWMKQTHDDPATVLSAIRRAVEARPQSAIPWITMALKKGKTNGHELIDGRPNSAPGRAAASEERFLAALGRGALGRLAKGSASGSNGQAPRGDDTPRIVDAHGQPKTSH